MQVSYIFISSIIVATSECSDCSLGSVEEGLQLDLVGRFNTHCSTGSLDNSGLEDYASNQVAQFNSTCGSPTPSDDHGLAQCNNVSQNLTLYHHPPPSLFHFFMSCVSSSLT